MRFFSGALESSPCNLKILKKIFNHTMWPHDENCGCGPTLCAPKQKGCPHSWWYIWYKQTKNYGCIKILKIKYLILPHQELIWKSFDHLSWLEIFYQVKPRMEEKLKLWRNQISQGFKIDWNVYDKIQIRFSPVFDQKFKGFSEI